MAEKYKSGFLEVSAKENINIEQIFVTLTNEIMKGIEKQKRNQETQNNIMICKNKKDKICDDSKTNCCK